MPKPTKENTPTKNVTTKELARMLTRGFERVALYLLKPLQRDVKHHDAELNAIRERLDRVEEKIGIEK